MKKCPQCSRDYTDDTLSFCLDDGTPLVYGRSDQGETTRAFIHETEPPSEQQTRSYGSTGEPDSLPGADQPADSGAKRAHEGFWIAVLPFKYRGNDSNLEALAEGLSEDIITGFSRFSYLRVIARSSSFRFSEESPGVRALGRELGARYLLEGSLRQGGSSLRLSVQLVDTITRTHIWAETYDRTFDPDSIFELQDDLVPRIVSTVADMHGFLPRSMGHEVSDRKPEELRPYEAVLRSFAYFEKLTPEELSNVRSGLKLALQKKPNYADAWAMLALLEVQDYTQEAGHRQEILDEGLKAAQRAVEAGPSNHLAFASLAQALFFQKDYQSFSNAVERSVALNPNDGSSIAVLAELLVYASDDERGLELASRARQLNPHHPGWYWFADFYAAYEKGDYRDALGFALRINMPGHYAAHCCIAAAYGQLGEVELARKALSELLSLRPDFATPAIRLEQEKWFNPDYSERMIEGLRKAGLEIKEG